MKNLRTSAFIHTDQVDTFMRDYDDSSDDDDYSSLDNEVEVSDDSIYQLVRDTGLNVYYSTKITDCYRKKKNVLSQNLPVEKVFLSLIVKSFDPIFSCIMGNNSYSFKSDIMPIAEGFIKDRRKFVRLISQFYWVSDWDEPLVKFYDSLVYYSSDQGVIKNLKRAVIEKYQETFKVQHEDHPPFFDVGKTVREKLRLKFAYGPICTDSSYGFPPLLKTIIKFHYSLDNGARYNVEGDPNKFIAVIKKSEFSQLFSLLLLLNIYKNLEIERVIRPTLDDSVTFESNSMTEFLAQLRLSNRSDKRMVRNEETLSRTEDAYSYYTDTTGTGVIPPTYNIFRTWIFGRNKSLALDTHKFYSTGSRSDEVVSLGSYDFIILTLKKMNKVGLSDGVIAANIRNILANDLVTLPLKIDRYSKQNIIRDLTRLTFLLFGCETSRDPAAFIQHQMIIDLVISEFITWEDAIANYMPLRIEGAVSGARILHSKYGRYRYDHSSEANEAKAKEIIKRNALLVGLWFKYKNFSYPEKGFSLLEAVEEYQELDNERNLLRDILYFIEEKMEEFDGFELDSTDSSASEEDLNQHYDEFQSMLYEFINELNEMILEIDSITHSCENQYIFRNMSKAESYIADSIRLDREAYKEPDSWIETLKSICEDRLSEIERPLYEYYLPKFSLETFRENLKKSCDEWYFVYIKIEERVSHSQDNECLSTNNLIMAEKYFVGSRDPKTREFQNKGSVVVPKLITLKNGVDAWDIDVMGDGNCLYYSMIMSYLLPYVKAKEEFSNKFLRIFGDSHDDENLRTSMLDYDGSSEWCATYLKDLVNGEGGLRSRLAERLEASNDEGFIAKVLEHYEYSKKDDSKMEAFCSLVRGDNSFGNIGEATLFASLTGMKVHLHRYNYYDVIHPNGNLTALEAGDTEEAIRISFVYLQDGEGNKVGHYHYLILKEQLTKEMNDLFTEMSSNVLANEFEVTDDYKDVADSKHDENDSAYDRQTGHWQSRAAGSASKAGAGLGRG